MKSVTFDVITADFLTVFRHRVKRSMLLHRQRFVQNNIVFHLCLYFGQNWPTLQDAARYLCDSWATCFHMRCTTPRCGVLDYAALHSAVERDRWRSRKRVRDKMEQVDDDEEIIMVSGCRVHHCCTAAKKEKAPLLNSRI